MNPTTQRTMNIVAIVGLSIGAVFGLAGTFVAQANLRSAFWGIDGVGLIVATALLTLKYFRQGNDFVAAGFLVFAIGESVMLAGTPAGLAESVPSFGAGTALWAAALLLVSIPEHFDAWIRAVSVLAASLFTITSAQIFWGEKVFPTSSPLPFFAYPFLVANFVGWITALMRENNATESA